MSDAALVVTALHEEQVARVDARLPLNRLDQWRTEGSTYLIAWDGDIPVGHAHIAWGDTHLALPRTSSCRADSGAAGSLLG